MKPFNPRVLLALLLLGVSQFSLEGAGRHPGDTLEIVPGSSAGLRVEVRGGTVTLENGRRVEVKPAVLEVAPPQIRTFEAAAPAGTRLKLTPAADEAGTAIGGDYYRVWRPESLKVYKTDGTLAESGTDFQFDPVAGKVTAIGDRLGLPGSGEIRALCEAALPRLDLVQVDLEGNPSLKRGPTTIACPALPRADHSQTAVAGIYIAPWRDRIDKEDIFVIEPHESFPAVNPEAINQTVLKLRDGQRLVVAFIGDEVSTGAEAPGWEDAEKRFTGADKSWRGQFVHQLEGRYRGVEIHPVDATAEGATALQGEQLLGALLEKTRPDLTVLAFGMHDRMDTSVRAALAVEEYRNAMRELVQSAVDAGSEVILVDTLLPAPWVEAEVTARTRGYNKALRELAHNAGATLVRAQETFAGMAAEGYPPFSQLHDWRQRPGELGHRMITHALMQAIGQAEDLVPMASSPDAMEAHRTAIPQPVDVPGHWRAGPQALPEFDEIVDQRRTRLPVYGLYSWQMEYIDYHSQIREVGWPTLRLSGPLTDEVMRLLAKDEVEVMMTVAARDPFPSPGFPQGKWQSRFTHDSDESFIEAFVEDVRWVLERYGPQGEFFKEHPDLPYAPIRFLEVFNEPNLWYMDRARDDVRSHYPHPDPEVQAAIDANRQRLYTDLLKATYRAIKEEWPEVTVVGFSACGVNKLDVPFIRAIHERFPDVVNYYDIISIHPYNRPAPPEGDYLYRKGDSYSIANSLAEIRACLKRAGAGDKPVWYTELGWTVEAGSESVYGPASAHTGRDVSPLLHAAYCARMYIWSLRLGVERLTMMYVKDADRFNAGFFTNEHPPRARPAAIAVKEQIALMPHPKLAGALSDGEQGTYAYWLQGDPSKRPDGDVLMVWNIEGATAFEMDWPGDADEVEVVDMLGGRSRAPVMNSRLRLEIGPYPVYLMRP